MSYTTKERNEIYKEALSLLPTVKSHNYDSFSICCAMEATKRGLLDDLYAHRVVDKFEELQDFKPDEYDTFWLPRNDLQTRQIILDFCILMTENETS